MPCLAFAVGAIDLRVNAVGIGGTVTIPSDFPATPEEFKQHMQEKIEWLKNLPADQKEALIEGVAMRLEKAKKQLSDFIGTLSPETKEKLKQFHDSVQSTIQKIRAMTPAERKEWKQNLQSRLEELRKNKEEVIKRIDQQLKLNPQLQNIFNKIEDVIMWVKNAPVSEVEALRAYFMEKIENSKKQLEIIKNSPKYLDLKRRIDALKESKTTSIEQLKTGMQSLFNDIKNELSK